MSPPSVCLQIRRDIFGAEFTLSTLAVDHKPFGYVVEDVDRGLDSAMPLAEIQRRKVKTATAIPTGRYLVKRTWSNRFQRLMPLVCDVIGYQGIRVHPGNVSVDTEGCILPGMDRGVSSVVQSKVACDWLDAHVFLPCEPAGVAVWLEISREPVAWAASLATRPGTVQTGGVGPPRPNSRIPCASSSPSARSPRSGGHR